VKRILVFAILWFSFTAVSAQTALPAGVLKVRQVEGVTEYRLGNGLQVLLYPDPSKPTVTVNVTYMVGSRHESYGETGMAHLLEHLLFKGSKKYPAPEKELARRGFKNNATTWHDRTNYFSTFQASEDNLRWALGWKADSMTNSTFSKKDLDSEMTVVRNEFESGENNPTRVMLQRGLSTMFDWHNYGNPTIGNRSDIENVRIDNLRGFYRRYYQPDNASLTVAGRLDENKTIRWIAETFGRVPKPARTLPPLWTTEPTQNGERSFFIRRRGDTQIALLGYRMPSSLHPDSDVMSVATEILGHTPNGRLHQELVQKGLAASVFAFLFPTRDPGMVMFFAVVKKGDPVERARDRLIEVVESTFGAQPPAEAELNRVRKDAETTFERTLGNPEDFGVALSEYVALGDWRLFFLARNRVPQIQSEAVAEVTQKYLRRDNRTVGIFVPEDEPQRAQIPATPTALERLADFKPRPVIAAGEAFDPSQDNIDKRTRRVTAGDLKLALLPKKTRGEIVNVAMNFRWGDVPSLTGESIDSLLADAMVMRGTSKMTRQQIADEMSRLKMVGTAHAFQTTREYLPDALRLSAHVLREASFPAAEFDQLKREVVTSMQAQVNDPEARSRDALATHFNVYPEGDPRHYIPLPRRIEAVQKAALDEVRKFHADFWGTARGEISVVGDFDDKSAEALLRELYSDWASRAPYARVLREPRAVATERIFVDTPDKENAFFRGRININLRDDDPDFAPLMLANYILGGGSGLSSRLADRLRQRDGLSYYTGSTVTAGPHDRAGEFRIVGLVAPQNTVRFEQGVREELARLLKDGFTAKEIDDGRNGLLQERAVARAQDETLVAAWIANLDAGRTFQFSKAFEARVRSLTPAEVLATVRRHIDPARMTVVIAGDAKKGAK